MAFSGLKAPGSLEPFTKLEIEHILPDIPKSELRATWAAENPNAVYDDYKNRLGNLTLLENRFFPDFICELQDGRILVLEYKGEAYKTNDDSKEKCLIGKH